MRVDPCSIYSGVVVLRGPLDCVKLTIHKPKCHKYTGEGISRDFTSQQGGWGPLAAAMAQRPVESVEWS